MIIACSALLCAFAIAALLLIRDRDLPPPAPVSPFQHLDERKAAIYENLRDLQFEYRVGKLSDTDYQQTKLDLQKELAGVLAEIDRIKAELQLTPSAAPPSATPKQKPAAAVCGQCGARFAQALKFCGECGAPIAAARKEKA